MIDWLIALDHRVFFFFNGLHQDWLDPIMFWISDRYIWIPLYLLLIFLTAKKYGIQAIFWIIGLILAVAATDQFCSGFMKGYFERFRPSRDPTLKHMVYIVNNYTGGKYGFSSSHAGNSFSVALFFFLLLKPYFKHAWTLFVWAAVVSYSRIYLGVHFPGDIIVGAIVGCIFSALFHFLTKKVINKKFNSVS